MVTEKRKNQERDKGSIEYLQVTKVCYKCGTEKSLDKFYKNKRSKDGRAHVCAKCSNRYSIKWYSAHKKLFREFKDYPTMQTEDGAVIDYHGIVVRWTREEYARLIGIKSGGYING